MYREYLNLSCKNIILFTLFALSQKRSKNIKIKIKNIQKRAYFNISLGKQVVTSFKTTKII